MTDAAKIIENFEEKKATQLPKPQGYHILCAVPEIEDKFDTKYKNFVRC